MVDYTLSTKGFLKKLFQGVCKEKIFKTVIKDVSYVNMKIILLFLSKHSTKPSSKYTTTN